MQVIKAQYDRMLETNIIPCFEFELSDGEFLTVDIDYSEKGIVFSFDSEQLPTYFSGNVEKLEAGIYVYLFDEYFDSLDYYLQEIHLEVVEGFILPNGMDFI